MNKYYRNLVVCFMAFFVTAIFLSNSYRDYIYSNGIADFGIADAGANFLVVPILSIFLILINHKYSAYPFALVLRVTLFYILAEIASFFFPAFGIFDLADLTAYIVGAGIANFSFKVLKIDKNDFLVHKKY